MDSLLYRDIAQIAACDSALVRRMPELYEALGRGCDQAVVRHDVRRDPTGLSQTLAASRMEKGDVVRTIRG